LNYVLLEAGGLVQLPFNTISFRSVDISVAPVSHLFFPVVRMSDLKTCHTSQLWSLHSGWWSFSEYPVEPVSNNC